MKVGKSYRKKKPTVLKKGKFQEILFMWKTAQDKQPYVIY